jgi:hypothetical protein
VRTLGSALCPTHKTNQIEGKKHVMAKITKDGSKSPEVSVDAPVAERQRSIRRRNRGSGTKADWRGVSSELIKELITNVSEKGGAVRFGYSRDGGAFAVGILGDGEPYTEYCRPTEDVDLFMGDLAADFRDDEEPSG